MFNYFSIGLFPMKPIGLSNIIQQNSFMMVFYKYKTNRKKLLDSYYWISKNFLMDF